MLVGNNRIQLGASSNPNENFVIQTPPFQDGTLEIRKGNLDSPGALVATFNENGLADPREMVTVTGSRSLSVDYTNTTEMPITVYFTCTQTAAGGLCAATLNGSAIAIGYRPEGNAEIGVNFDVPPGATYRIGLAGASSYIWREYRLPEGA